MIREKRSKTDTFSVFEAVGILLLGLVCILEIFYCGAYYCIKFA